MLGYVFPGQGTQKSDMGRDLVNRYEIARRTYQTASEVLEYDLVRASANTNGELDDTQVIQPAILVHGIACWRVLREIGAPLPKVLAGHSLGEITAFCASGAIEFEDAVAIVKRRGEIMKMALPNTGMAAVLGVDSTVIRSALTAVPTDLGVVTVANFNSPDQIVVSGHLPALSHLQISLQEKGAIVKRLRANVAVHTPLLQDSVPHLAEVVDNMSIRTPSIPVVSSITAEPCVDSADVVASTLAQLTRPVDWPTTLDRLAELGVNRLIEIGVTPTLMNLTLSQRSDMAASCCGSTLEIDRFQPAADNTKVTPEARARFIKGCLRIVAGTAIKDVAASTNLLRSLNTRLWQLLETTDPRPDDVSTATDIIRDLLGEKGLSDDEADRLLHAAADQAGLQIRSRPSSLGLSG